MFEDDERFTAVERSREREDLFEGYIAELQKKVGILKTVYSYVYQLVIFLRDLFNSLLTLC